MRTSGFSIFFGGCKQPNLSTRIDIVAQSYIFYPILQPSTVLNFSDHDLQTATQVQLASAKLAICLKNSVFGFEKPSFFRGLRFSFFATFLMYRS
ncbi:hypothetical protein, partial [Muribaculum intestinale]|uniref:hypothetical protein n=1 Tax=Muribaculum intestinale TaxID=1796646 RepID=UPI0024B9C326